ncbi:MAG: hypothetical protein ACSNEK_06370 [Parachlamydiaceae bacterium]
MSFKLFKLAADQVHALASFAIGFFYEDGKVVEKDEQQAIKYYPSAAQKGDRCTIDRPKENGRSRGPKCS